MVLCIGQLPQSWSIGWFWVCADQMLNFLRSCVPFTNSYVECYFILMNAIIIGIFLSPLSILNYTLRLSEII